MNTPLLSPTVSESTYLQIRTDIIFGRLRPEEKLRLDGLKERYGASVSTLREILNRLTSEGFVVAEGQRGFEVAPISPENLKEVSALRKLLECYALDLSFRNGDMDWEGGVVAAHHKLGQMEQRMIAGDASVKETWKRYDWEFHQAMIKACGSQSLIEIHAAIFDKYLRYQMISLTFRGQKAADEHRQLLEVALKRDSERAQELLRQHIDNGVEHALASKALQK
ncbi:MAG TPA: GntR family transcriptional regulator [Pararhizobium sp.]|nr:GntR family transcriptional regulator [Pararhizobium sp.]